MTTETNQPDAESPATSGSERRRREPSLAREVFGALPRPARWAVWGVVGLVLVLLAALAVGAYFVRRPLPQTSGEITLPGLSSSVTVTRDAYGVPTLWGDTDRDLVMAQGYVHAQERFFEMDVRRHLTAGRLAELFGEQALDTDKVIRTMGWRRVAEQEVALVSPETRADLDAYAEGVNAYLSGRSSTRIAFEYTLLGLTGLDYAPEPWTSVDTLAWLKAMAWDLSGNLDEEVARVSAGVNHTPDEVAELFPSYDARIRRPIVESGAVVDGVFDQDATANATRLPMRAPYALGAQRAFEQVHEAIGAVPPLLGEGDGIGSNSWVVSGSRTVTGKPLLANDPHLGVSQPGIWMQVGLRCRQLTPDCGSDVAGFSFAGTPGIVIGHNAHIAWGFTNLGADVADFYLERVRDDTVEYDGKQVPLRVRTEMIKVRGGDDFTLKVRESRHGPLISDVSREWSSVGANAPAEGQSTHEEVFAVALRWTALDPGNTADAIRGLNRAHDWDSFRQAARDFEVPAQNLVYADVEGHIGYQAPGRIPIRKSGNDGTMPVEGWLPENDWTGKYVGFEALPHLFDPADAMLVAANQEVIDGDYPYEFTRDWDQGYRAQRIRELLGTRDTLSVEDMSDLQLDDRNPMAEVLVPYLLAVDPGGAYYSGGQQLLNDWDLGDDADSAAAAYFNVTWAKLLALTFDDDLRPAARPSGGQRWFAVVTQLLRDPESSWWDDATTEEVIETRDDILVRAMREAREELTLLRDHNPQNWAWGDLHQLDLEHQTLGTSGIGVVEWLLNRPGTPVSGGSGVVNATAWDRLEGYRVTAAPSMRMVVDLSDFDSSRWVALTGTSGHPGSSHYDDQTPLFAEGQTLPWPFSRDEVENAGEDVLTLKPGSTD